MGGEAQKTDRTTPASAIICLAMLLSHQGTSHFCVLTVHTEQQEKLCWRNTSIHTLETDHSLAHIASTVHLTRAFWKPTCGDTLEKSHTHVPSVPTELLKSPLWIVTCWPIRVKVIQLNVPALETKSCTQLKSTEAETTYINLVNSYIHVVRFILYRYLLFVCRYISPV